jgi:hypothetical protein
VAALQDVGEALMRDSEQARGARDLSSGCFERLPYQLALEKPDLIVQLAARPGVKRIGGRRLP